VPVNLLTEAERLRLSGLPKEIPTEDLHAHFTLTGRDRWLPSLAAGVFVFPTVAQNEPHGAEELQRADEAYRALREVLVGGVGAWSRYLRKTSVIPAPTKTPARRACATRRPPFARGLSLLSASCSEAAEASRSALCFAARSQLRRITPLAGRMSHQ
jgi:hypothetical protein